MKGIQTIKQVTLSIPSLDLINSSSHLNSILQFHHTPDKDGRCIKWKMSDYMRCLIRDHKLLIERMKELESENLKLQLELKASKEVERKLRQTLDYYSRNQIMPALQETLFDQEHSEIGMHLSRWENSYQVLSEISQQFTIQIDMDDTNQLLQGETPGQMSIQYISVCAQTEGFYPDFEYIRELQLKLEEKNKIINLAKELLYPLEPLETSDPPLQSHLEGSY